MSEGMQPDRGGTPMRDLDSLETLHGGIDFQSGGNGLADVTVDIPPTGPNEQPGSNFTVRTGRGHHPELITRMH